MVLIEKGCKAANGGRIVTDPKVARCLPGHTFVILVTLLSGKFKTQLVDRFGNTFGNTFGKSFARVIQNTIDAC